MTPLLLLAEKVEGLKGPDREVDRDIALLRAEYDDPEDLGCFLDPAEAVVGGGGQTYAPPAYTASLDAAMLLVPEGWGWLVSQPNEKAIASGLLKKRTPVMGEVQYGCDHRYAVAAATPALALVAVSLRARAAMEAGE